MRTSILSKMLFPVSLAIMLYFNVVLTYGQSDPKREIMIYFSKGVDRTNIGLPARISSIAIQRVLKYFNINQEQISSAFPNFNEADTLKRTSDV